MSMEFFSVNNHSTKNQRRGEEASFRSNNFRKININISPWFSRQAGGIIPIKSKLNIPSVEHRLIICELFRLENKRAGNHPVTSSLRINLSDVLVFVFEGKHSEAAIFQSPDSLFEICPVIHLVVPFHP